MNCFYLIACFHFLISAAEANELEDPQSKKLNFNNDL